MVHSGGEQSKVTSSSAPSHLMGRRFQNRQEPPGVAIRLLGRGFDGFVVCGQTERSQATVAVSECASRQGNEVLGIERIEHIHLTP